MEEVKCCKCGIPYTFTEELVAHLRHRHTPYDAIRRRLMTDYKRRGVAHFNAHYFARQEAREKIKNVLVSLMKGCGLEEGSGSGCSG